MGVYLIIFVLCAIVVSALLIISWLLEPLPAQEQEDEYFDD